MAVIQNFILFIFAFYIVFLLLVNWGWLKIPINDTKLKPKNTFITIIISVRNEIVNIEKLLQCIEKQTYNKDFFELIIVDDLSTDGTFESINSYKVNSSFNLTLYSILDFFNKDSELKGIYSPKKMAITEAIKLAKGSLIVSTDGDCVFEENWLESIVKYYESADYKFISGPVTFHQNSFFDRLQIVEFASLVGAGAASIQLNSPNMCNGANIAYEKSAFEAVNGFAGFDDIPSGDDEFLMHKIAHKFPNQIGFIKDKAAIVTTKAQINLTDFLNQRKRWASKWNKYLNWKNTILALFVFGLNFSRILFFIFVLFDKFNLILFIVFFTKLILEGLFIANILSFLDRKKEVFLIPLVQMIYPFYVVFTAINSLSKSYTWKGRNY